MPLFRKNREKESLDSYKQSYLKRRLGSSEEIATLINPALDIVFGFEFQGLSEMLYSSGAMRSGPEKVTQEWEKVASEYDRKFDDATTRALDPLRSVRSEESDPMMMIHLGTESFLSYYMAQVREEGFAFWALMVEGNKRKYRSHQMVAEEAEGWVERIKPQLVVEFSELKRDHSLLFDTMNISENNLYDLGAKDLLPLDSGMRNH